MKKHENLIVFLVSIMVLSLLRAYILKGKEVHGEETMNSITTTKIELVEERCPVTITCYNPTKEQCDSDPLTTADGSRIDINKLKKGSIRWCAVSRDLLKHGNLKYGDKIYIKVPGRKDLTGTYEIHDTMAPKMKKTVDLLVHHTVSPTKVEGYYTVR